MEEESIVELVPMEQMDNFAAELLEDLRLKEQQSKTPMSQD